MEKQDQDDIFTVSAHPGTHEKKSISLCDAREVIDERKHDNILSLRVGRERSEDDNKDDRDRYFKDENGNKLTGIKLKLPKLENFMPDDFTVTIKDAFWKSDDPCAELSYLEISKWIVAWVLQKECLWPCLQEKGNPPKFNIQKVSCREPCHEFKLISSEEWKSQSSQKIIPAEIFPDKAYRN